MSGKSLIWFGLIVGSSIGGFLPMLWGGSLFGFASVFLTAVGGLVGIWAGFRFAKATGAL